MKIFQLYKNAFSGFSREVYYLACVIFINRVGTMVLPFLSLYLVQKLNLTVADAGIVLMCFGLGALSGTFIGGRLVDRLGAIRVQILSLFFGGIGFFVLSYLSEFYSILSAIYFTALANEMIRPSNAAAFVIFSKTENRTRAFAMNRLAINLGMAIGPAMGGFLATKSYTFLFIVDGSTCVFAALATMFLFREKIGLEKKAAKKEQIKAANSKDYPLRPFLIFVLIAFLISMMFFQLFGTFPLYLKSVYLLNEFQIGMLFTINGVLIVIFEMLVAHYAERRNQIKILRIGILLLSAAFFLLPFGRSFGIAVAMVIILTFGEILSLPLLGNIVSKVIDPARLGKMMGYYTSVFALSHILAPIFGTQIYENLSPEILWFTITALAIPIIILSIIFQKSAKLYLE